MGAIFGRKFVRDDKIDGQGKQFLLFAKKINMQKYEVDRIYEVFFGLENKATHLVDIKEMFQIYRMPYTLMASVITQVFDRSKAGFVNFMEFVIILWSFLATDEDELARLCFDIFDVFRSGSLDIGEIRYLVHAVWEFKPSKKCLSALKKLELNTDGIVSLPEFILLNKHHKELLKPLRRTKDQLRKKTVFTRYWKQLMWRRKEDFGSQSIFTITNRVDPSFVESSMEYLNLRTDIVPVQFVEQWNYIQRRKAQRGVLHQELPYEIKEQLKPHPLNIHTKKTLRTVAKGMVTLSRFRRKSNAKRNSVVSIQDFSHGSTVHGEDETRDENSLSEVDAKEDQFDPREASLQGPPKISKPAPFDDSFLGSLKAPQYIV